MVPHVREDYLVGSPGDDGANSDHVRVGSGDRIDDREALISRTRISSVPYQAW
jgi:hypothetical protein